MLSLLGLHGICAAEGKVADGPQVEIEIGPDDDDYEYYDEPPEVWIGPGLYYGVWFDDEYEYHRWYRDRYYRRHGYYRHEEYDHHGGDHHDGGHQGGGHHH